MQQYGQFRVWVRLADTEAKRSDEEMRQEIADVLAAHFGVEVYTPSYPQGPHPRPGVTVRSGTGGFERGE